MPGRMGWRRWLTAAGVAALVVVGVVVRNHRSPESTGTMVLHREVTLEEALLCPVPVGDGDQRSDPTSWKLQRADPPAPFDQDPRCPDEPALRVPGALPRHDEDPDEVGAVILAGRLVFDAGSSCFYLDTEVGPLGIVWPRHTGASFGPPRLIGPGGETLAAAGVVVRVRGRHVEGAAQACGPVEDGGPSFFTGAITVG